MAFSPAEKLGTYSDILPAAIIYDTFYWKQIKTVLLIPGWMRHFFMKTQPDFMWDNPIPGGKKSL